MQYDNIKVGLGLVLIKENKVLLARRKLANNGQGEFGGPGGALHPGESFEDAIRRELLEECGPHIKIANLRMLCTINYRNGQSSTTGLASALWQIMWMAKFCLWSQTNTRLGNGIR